MIAAFHACETSQQEQRMSGRNDGNSGSDETRRQPEYKDNEDNAGNDKSGAATQADGTEDDEQVESDVEIEREASGE